MFVLAAGLFLSGSLAFAAGAASPDNAAARPGANESRVRSLSADRPAKPMASPARAGKTGRPGAEQAKPSGPPPARTVPTGRAQAAPIAATLERIRFLSLGVDGQERELARLRGEEAALAAEHQGIEAEKKRAGAFAARLARALWPVAAGGRLDPAQVRQAAWDENDRRFWWLAAVSNQAASAASEYARQAALLAANLARGQALRQDMERLRERVETGRLELAGQRAEFLAERAALRGDAFDLGAELAGLAAAGPGAPEPAGLAQRSASLGGLAAARGKLPWPVAGDLAAPPPHGKGIGFATAPAAPVAAVHPGVLVFAGPVRGMGEVAVVDHGQGYFSVYAYLDRVLAERGTFLQAGQALGQAGNYPPAGGFGLYFELRFHEKAINPGLWLVAGP